MWIPAGFAFVLGAVLGLRYKVVALAPATAGLLLLAACDGVIHGGGVWSISFACGLTLTCLEFGYVAASALQSPSLRVRSADEVQTASETESPPRAVAPLKPSWPEEGSTRTSSAVLYMQIMRRSAANASSISGSPDAPASPLQP